MKKICFLINHLENSNGVTKAAIDIVNMLSERDDVEVCLKSIFRFDKDMRKIISPKVKLDTLFGFYFHGFSKIVDAIPDKILYSMIFKEDYDIEVGFCFELPNKIVAVSKNKRAKHLAWMHGYDEGLVLRDYYKKCDKVICVSKHNADRLANELGDVSIVDYCYNLVDDKRVQKMGEEPVEQEKGEGILFSTVGRLSPEKGYSRLLDCVARLKSDGYSFHLWIVGDGPEREVLKEKAKKLDILDRVFFAGEQRNPHKYTSKSDVFVCSSFSEGYSTACTEAILLGVPVITTNVSGGAEIINTSEAGLLVGIETEELYNGMKMVLDKPEMIKDWKEKVAETRHKFSYESRKNKLLSVLGLD